MTSILKELQRIDKELAPRCQAYIRVSPFTPNALEITAIGIKGSDLCVCEVLTEETITSSLLPAIDWFIAKCKNTHEAHISGNRPKAPWKDYKGNAIFEGSKVRHPKDGVWGVVIIRPQHDSPSDKWVIQYEDGIVTRLCTQIDRGELEVIQ